MNHAPVTVVIPTYNRQDIVHDAIDSVLAQTLPPAQVIVVDDGSKDDTAGSLRSYGSRIHYHFQFNAGLSAARNAGIELATEPFVAVLDDDDVWHPRKLEMQMRCLERNPEIGLLGTEQFDWPAATFPGVPGDADRLLVRVSWEQLVVKTLIQVSSVIFRRSLIERIGGFDTTLRSSEDRDFFLRVAEVDCVGMLAAPLLGYRDTPGSMCKNPAVREEAMRQVLRRLDQRNAWRGRRLLRRKSYGFMHLSCADVYARAGRHARAAVHILESLACYPKPYRRDEARMLFERPKRLAVSLLRLLRLKQPDGLVARKAPSVDALHAAAHPA